MNMWFVWPWWRSHVLEGQVLKVNLQSWQLKPKHEIAYMIALQFPLWELCFADPRL